MAHFSDVDKKDGQGRTDLMKKSEENNFEEVAELLRDGAFPDFEDDNGLTALHYALKRYSQRQWFSTYFFHCIHFN
jgi:ankyrin repeat protein